MSTYDSDRYCYYLERICRLGLRPEFKSKIVDSFLAIRTIHELRELCYRISDKLINLYGYNEYFIP